MNRIIDSSIIPVLTILCSGITSAIVTYKLNKSHELDKLRKARLEELYQRFDEYNRINSSFYLPFHMAMLGKINYNDANDLFINSKNDKNTIIRVKILISLYFPKLKVHLLNFENINGECFKIISKFRKSYEKDGKPRLDLAEELFSKNIESENMYKDIIVKIEKLI